ncbi:hypothetical protein BBJ28_00011143 [Nothophytophthora sp. Chile5]|nr:hypothetical protein BBJ28_00011143 [Nothophytophthora sp. Chile5]
MDGSSRDSAAGSAPPISPPAMDVEMSPEVRPAPSPPSPAAAANVERAEQPPQSRPPGSPSATAVQSSPAASAAPFEPAMPATASIESDVQTAPPEAVAATEDEPETQEAATTEELAGVASTPHSDSESAEEDTPSPVPAPAEEQKVDESMENGGGADDPYEGEEHDVAETLSDSNAVSATAEEKEPSTSASTSAPATGESATSEQQEKMAPSSENKAREAASAAIVSKKWFEAIPLVLQSFRSRNREQIKPDTPGSFLAKANWSKHFQSAIVQMLAERTNSRFGAGASTPHVAESKTGEKRKRAAKDVEVITIDDSDDEERGALARLTGESVGYAQRAPPLSDGTSDWPGDGASMPSQQYGAGRGAENTGTHLSQPRLLQVYSQLQVPHPASAAATHHQPSISQTPTITEPIPFPQELMRAASASSMSFPSPYNSPSVANSSNGVTNSNGNGEAQPTWNYSTSQFPVTSMPTNPSGGMVYATAEMGSQATGMQPQSAAMDIASGMWSTTSAIGTDLGSNSLLPLSGAIFAENALVDALLDRYNEMNQSVLNMELKSEQLTKQVAAATYQGLYAASHLMVKLNEMQQLLETAKRQRDKLLIAMIIQSNDVMAAVRLLRLSELSDVPQVPMLSHRKCLQLSLQVNEHKRALLELNGQMATTLSEPSLMTPHVLNARIRSINRDIQVREKTIKQLKNEREAEIVRIVQYSHSLREALKHEFHRNLAIQQRQRQQQQAAYR